MLTVFQVAAFKSPERCTVNYQKSNEEKPVSAFFCTICSILHGLDFKLNDPAKYVF